MVNLKYKERLFSFIFGSVQRKDWTLSLYNAVNYSSYTNPEYITIMTMEDVLYIGMKMDIETAVGTALNDMPQDFELKKFLIANKAEVTQMCLTEYNETKTMEMFKEEGREEGADALGKLIVLLTEHGKTELIMKTSTDSKVRKELYKKYNI